MPSPVVGDAPAPQQDPFQLCGVTIEGKYRIASVVGDGGFGVVYRGVHKGFGELIAVKCLKLPGALDEKQREDLLEQLRDEGRLLHRLSRVTSAIVQALDVGAVTTASGVWVPYLVLEWLEGTTLADFLRDRVERGTQGMPLREAIALLDPAARALAVAHKQKVAHRDVKPANLFVTEVGGGRTLKVLDFGIAKVLTNNSTFTEALAATKLGPTAFTPRYGSPEQFNKQRGASGPWTDVFALALILVELVTGQKALQGDDPTQLYIASADPAFRPTLRARGVDVPDAVERVVERALAVEPKHRFADAGEFWDALVEASGVTSVRPPPAPVAAAVEPPVLVPSPLSAATRAENGKAVATQAGQGTQERLALDPTLPVEDVKSVERDLAAGSGPSARAKGTESHDPMAETPAGARAQAGSDRAPSQAAPAARTRSSARPPSAGLANPQHALARQRTGRGWRAFVAPFFGGALVFGCAYFAYAMLHSPDRTTRPLPAPSARPRSDPSRANASPAAPGPNASAPTASLGPPPAPEGMIYLAPTTFKMGDGKAAREVTLSRGYFLDREEVTVRQYAGCVAKRLCTAANRVTLAPATTPDDQDADEHATDSPADPPTQAASGSPEFVETWSRACNEPRKASDHPINCVDYESAAAFCRFKGRRLPTEAEWELAARGTAGRAFPWGPEPPDCQRACLDKNASCRPAGEGVVTCAVNKHAADHTPEGIADLGGNVSEWVADGFASQIPGGRDPIGNASSMLRVVRGGNFVDGAERARAVWRGGLPAGTALATVGFRCAMDAPY